jgi:hypothetical protein
MFFVLKFELILIIGSNNVLTEGARKVYRWRRVGHGCSKASLRNHISKFKCGHGKFLREDDCPVGAISDANRSTCEAVLLLFLGAL